MPIPLTTFFRPESVMKNNKCTTLIKGNILYDYASSNITWTVTGGTFTSSAISQSESWTYFIPRSISMSTTSQFKRSATFGSSKNFTVMFRIYLSSLSSPGMTGTTVVGNGTPGGPPPLPPSYFWAIAFFGSSSTTMKFQMLWTSNGVQQPNLNIGPSGNVEAGRWYHIAVKVVDNGSYNSLYGYTDGVQTGTIAGSGSTYVDAGVGNTVLGNLGMGQAQGFELAEFVFLEKALSDDEIKAYATSPYI